MKKIGKIIRLSLKKTSGGGYTVCMKIYVYNKEEKDESAYEEAGCIYAGRYSCIIWDRTANGSTG